VKVADLAAELEVPASAVIEQCQRFGIDASWAGADLSAADVVVLRAELAGADAALDLTDRGEAAVPDRPAVAPDLGEEEHAAPTTLAEPPPSSVPAVAEGPPAARPAARRSTLPPTAVGSLPEMIDEVTPAREAEPPVDASVPGGPIRTFHGIEGPAGEVRRPPHQAPVERRLDRGIPAAVVALLLAAGTFAASNLSTTPVVIFLVWLLAVVFVLVGLFTANRSRHRATMHPDRYVGRWGAIAVMVVAGLCLIGVGDLVYTIVRDEPAETAPLKLGELSAVRHGRWGWQQFLLIKNHGWDRPSKVEGTCWIGSNLDDKREPREPNRVEHGTRSTSCTNRHTVEIAEVFTYDRDADAPYPGVDQLKARGTRHCASLFAVAARKAGDVTLQFEYPTAAGWDEGDHEIGCALVTGPRKTPLLD
jgi:hypothetical protein